MGSSVSPISIHSQLLDKKSELLLALQDRGGIRIEGKAADPLDEAQASSARVSAADAVNRNMTLLRQVRKAISKIEDFHGTFGECEMCGEPIPEVRLSVVPWAENCIHCQHQKEIGEGGNHAS